MRCKTCNPGRTKHHILTDAQVKKIRQLYESTRLPPGADPKMYPRRWTYEKLAKKYKVNSSTIFDAVNYITYEWVK